MSTAAATSSYPGHTFHPFPTCFACGTAREEGDGLRIFPGAVGEGAAGHRIAAPWTPQSSLHEDWHAYVDEHPRASVAATWAALDCIGGWAGDLTERLMVLGRMTARIDALPVVGEPHVVVGEARGDEGRKTFTATTLYDADGRVVGTAEHLWVRVDPAAFADHHAYGSADVEALVARAHAADRVVCTLKDAVKLGPLWPRGAPTLWYVSQRVTVERGERVLEDSLGRLLAART